MAQLGSALAWIGIGALAILAAGWLGVVLGRRTARAFPGAAGALWLLMSFLKIDPPPPPRAERVTRDEEGAGDPPKR
jgi:hypothetical protein